MSKLNYANISLEINRIKEIFNNFIDKYRHERCKSLIEDYRKDLIEIEKKNKINLAFIGQYSAGKSSIISAITRNSEIKIGQNVTTDKTSQYEWNNINLVDTPGIKSDNPIHDNITYRYMDIADLLIYVITIQGFDKIIAEDFRRIAFDENRVNKMMLVVNKTSMEPSENKVNWNKNIESVIKPLSIKDLNVTYIDAQDYLESCREDDLELKRELELVSNFDELLENINTFVNENGLSGRLISELNIVNSYISRMINELSIDDENKKVLELLTRKRFIVEESRKSVMSRIDNEIEVLCNDILDISNECIEMITIEVEKDTLEDKFIRVNDSIDKKCKKCIDSIEEIISTELDDLINKINDLEESSLYKVIVKEFNTDIDFDININEKKNFNNLKNIPESLGDIGKFLGVSGNGFKSWCKNAESTGKGLKAVANSDAHKFILDAGHFFGKKFKPYEAVKLADKIGKAGEVLSKLGKGISIVGCIASPLIAAYEQQQEGKFEEHIKNARIETRKNFRSLSDNVKKNIIDIRNNVNRSIFEKELNNIDNTLTSLRNIDKLQADNIKELKHIQNQANKVFIQI